ncbi:MAG: 4'-phosphopantetheinyl transferase superfamily protein [Candidatus Latescibacterota bacterium]|nr:4'-phosphopantetheinyl transferase superfamily protein [Candidatus Latescibacterota bacterium]
MKTVIGNDVVHIADPGIAEYHRRTRFVERICAPEEWARIGDDEEGRLLLWNLWAAKEAAYKAVMKLRAGIVFAHRRFVVDESLREVRYDDLVLPLWSDHAEDWLHAVVTNGAEPGLSRVKEKSPECHQSQAVRDFACRAIAEAFAIEEGGLEIVRPDEADDRVGPPVLTRGGEAIDIDLSLSHDGPFVACAAVASQAT